MGEEYLTGKCDGKRPICTPCFRRDRMCAYATRSASAKFSMALKNDNYALQLKCDSLQKILDLFKSSSDEESINLTQMLKKSSETDASALLQSMQRGQSRDENTLDNSGLIRGTAAPSQTTVEFDLMLRYSVAYPTLVALDSPPSVLGSVQLRLPKAYEPAQPRTM